MCSTECCKTTSTWGLCSRCNTNPASDEPHSCPFAKEVDDEDTECHCCEACTEDCAMAI